MNAQDLLDSVAPFDEDAALRVVDAWLVEHGDVTEGVFFDLSIKQDDPDRWLKRARKRRAEWFKARGERVPPLPSSGNLE